MDSKELVKVRAINAALPFADPIMPSLGKYFTRDIGSYREHDRRRRALDRLIRLSRKSGLYDD